MKEFKEFLDRLAALADALAMKKINVGPILHDMADMLSVMSGYIRLRAKAFDDRGLQNDAHAEELEDACKQIITAVHADDIRVAQSILRTHGVKGV